MNGGIYISLPPERAGVKRSYAEKYADHSRSQSKIWPKILFASCKSSIENKRWQDMVRQDILRGELSSAQWYEDQFFTSEPCLYPSLDSLISSLDWIAFRGVAISLWEFLTARLPLSQLLQLSRSSRRHSAHSTWCYHNSLNYVISDTELCHRWYYAERSGVELRVEWLWSMINTFETKCPLKSGLK